MSFNEVSPSLTHVAWFFQASLQQVSVPQLLLLHITTISIGNLYTKPTSRFPFHYELSWHTYSIFFHANLFWCSQIWSSLRRTLTQNIWIDLFFTDHLLSLPQQYHAHNVTSIIFYKLPRDCCHSKTTVSVIAAPIRPCIQRYCSSFSPFPPWLLAQ